METPLLPLPRIVTGATRPSVPTPIETLLENCDRTPWPPLASTVVATTMPAEVSLRTIPVWVLPWTVTGPGVRLPAVSWPTRRLELRHRGEAVARVVLHGAVGHA